MKKAGERYGVSVETFVINIFVYLNVKQNSTKTIKSISRIQFQDKQP
jgi:hypothetical protein